MAELHRLSRNHLHINEGLPWDVFDAHGQLLLRRGYVIQRDTQIDALLERGMFVDAAEFKASAPQSAEPTKRVFDPVSIWKGIQGQLTLYYKDTPNDGSLPEKIRQLARFVMELCDRYPDLALAAIQLKEYKRYPVAHSLHVAVLAELIARRGDFEEESRISMLCAALTKNIAMADLQQMLTFQKAPLTEDQRAQIKAHPVRGVEILEQAGVSDEEWLRAVREHHEDEEGTGYPSGIKAPSLLAVLLHTCDCYLAMLSPRAHRKAITTTDAAREIYVRMGQGKENPFPALLVKEVGMYPPGAIVKLANGEIGVVFKRGQQTNFPVVATLINAKGLHQMDPVRRDTSNPQFKIVGVIPRESAMVQPNFEHIWCGRNS